MTRLLRPGRWLWRIGLGVPMLLGLVLALLVVISWLTANPYEAPDQWKSGLAEDLRTDQPLLFEEPHFYLVKLGSGDILALYNRDPESGCTVSWGPSIKFSGRKGWFRDSCHSSMYDLIGHCFGGPCPRGLDSFRVQLDNGGVLVQLRGLTPGPPPDFSAEPVNPPQ